MYQFTWGITMKKVFISFISLFLVFGSVFAQSANSDFPTENSKMDLSTRTIVPENQHTVDKTAKVKIEYMPGVDEIRIYYTSMYTTYDQGEAMNAILACLGDFIKDKQNGYMNYRYIEQDRDRFFKDDRGINWAQRISHVKLIR